MDIPHFTIRSVQRYWWAALALLALLLWGIFTPIAHQCIDELIYQLMARYMAEAGSLSIPNGYDELPVNPLVILFTQPTQGKLYPQYPSFYGVIAAPLYFLAGMRGLFLLNIASFIGVLWLIRTIAQRCFDDPAISRASVLVALLGTFLWNYSQSIWPHMSALFCVLLAFRLALEVAQQHRPFWRATLCGAAIGMGMNLRLDAAFALPGILAVLLFTPKNSWKSMLMLLPGLLLGIAFLSVTNHIKFNSLFPLTYGGHLDGHTAFSQYYPATMLAVCALLLACKAKPMQRAIQYRFPLAIAGAALLAAAAALMVNHYGFYNILVYFSGNRITQEPAVWFHVIKKSLLQSCPFILPLLVGLACGRRNYAAEGKAILLLLVVPLTYIVVFCGRNWHGGMSMQMRYLLPVLPFLSILGGYYVVRMTERSKFRFTRSFAWYMGLLLCLCASLAVYSAHSYAHQHAFIVRVVPLAIAAASALLAAAWELRGERFPALRAWVLGGFLLALFWGGCMAWIYDYHGEVMARQEYLDNYRRLESVIPDNAVLIHGSYEHHGLMKTLKPNIRMWNGGSTQDFKRTFEFYSARDIPLYLSLDNPRSWRQAQQLLGELPPGAATYIQEKRLIRIARP